MPSKVAVENHGYVWRVCCIALLIMILYAGVYKRAFIGTAIEKHRKHVNTYAHSCMYAQGHFAGTAQF